MRWRAIKDGDGSVLVQVMWPVVETVGVVEKRTPHEMGKVEVLVEVFVEVHVVAVDVDVWVFVIVEFNWARVVDILVVSVVVVVIVGVIVEDETRHEHAVRKSLWPGQLVHAAVIMAGIGRFVGCWFRSAVPGRVSRRTGVLVDVGVYVGYSTKVDAEVITVVFAVH